jgi:predicted metal-binding membrane protein
VSADERGFRATAALVFVASATATVAWCGSMAGGMPMPGGWTMSMAWMRMPGQTWTAAAATFMGMWILMMVAMMIPSLVPMLARYRDAVRPQAGPRLAAPTTLAAAGYLFSWTLVGAAVYPVGLAVAAAAMRSDALARAVPLATGAVLVLAGCLQLTPWKTRALACCRAACACAPPLAASPAGAWRHGVHLGRHCATCCTGFMAALLVGGVMDPGVMMLVAAAITAERLVPTPGPVARATGVLLVSAGTLVIARGPLV